MRDTDEDSIPDIVSRVVEDAKEVARAEINLFKARAATKVAVIRATATLFAIAGLLALLALIGLVMGLILTLAQYMNAGWATLTVVGATLALAGVFGWLGSRRWRRG